MKNLIEKLLGKGKVVSPAEKEIRELTPTQQRYPESREVISAVIEKRIAETTDFGPLSEEDRQKVLKVAEKKSYISKSDVTPSEIRSIIKEVLGRKPIPSGADEPVRKFVPPAEAEEVPVSKERPSRAA